MQLLSIERYRTSVLRGLVLSIGSRNESTVSGYNVLQVRQHIKASSVAKTGLGSSHSVPQRGDRNGKYHIGDFHFPVSPTTCKGVLNAKLIDVTTLNDLRSAARGRSSQAIVG